MNGFKYSQKKTQNEKKIIRKIIMKEKLYNRNFYFFELGFIFVLIPVLIASFVSAPFLYYYMVTQEFKVWPIIVLASLIVFSEILAIQYFVRRFYLEPHNMTFGQYLRYKFDTRIENIKSRDENKEPTLTWYSDLDDFIDRIRFEMKEQTEKVYSSVIDYYQNE
ncbi:MAG: hypothetical protein EAX90_12865 [Candidatus Heimdallarchaeota archaeon]|nr:hypothetical protein [Candidatus Heimdallarchaeota archaeon]